MASNELKYTEHDLLLAREMGALTTAVNTMNTTVTTYMKGHKKEHEKVWEKIDRHTEDISDQEKKRHWLYGFAAGIGAVFGVIGAWIKMKFFE